MVTFAQPEPGIVRAGVAAIQQDFATFERPRGTSAAPEPAEEGKPPNPVPGCTEVPAPPAPDNPAPTPPSPTPSPAGSPAPAPVAENAPAAPPPALVGLPVIELPCIHPFCPPPQA